MDAQQIIETARLMAKDITRKELEREKLENVRLLIIGWHLKEARKALDNTYFHYASTRKEAMRLEAQIERRRRIQENLKALGVILLGLLAMLVFSFLLAMVNSCMNML